MKTPHAIVVPYPVQGHVIPHMELSHYLVERGFKITFVNTEFNQKRIVATLHDNQNESQINLVTISDGLTEEDRNDMGKLTEALIRVFPREVEAVIKGINGSNDNDNITCIISDIGWLLAVVGENIGIQTATFWTMGAGILALISNIPKLIETGIINPDGTLVKEQTIQLSPRMPLMRTTHFVWNCIGDLKTQKVAFDASIVYNEGVKSVNWHLCNTSYELEPAAFELIPNVLPIGPLLASSDPRKSLGCFWPEDSTCLNWLNQQPSRSVIYVAFGSSTVFDHIQFQELAMGLELSNQPFLWVVRPDLTKGSSDVYPDGFQTRVATQAQMVAWAPQQKVLSHPSVACFISHCGWNSTVESLSNGVPFLCWPYFADQFQNQSQICDVWKVGLRLNKNESGIVPRQEIKEKVNGLLANDGIRTRVTELKETIKKSVGQRGSSSTNLDKFVKGIQNW